MTGQEHPPHQRSGQASVDLYWLPLGAGDKDRCVRGSGRLYEALVATGQHRRRLDLYHSALFVRLGGDAFAIEMAPVWAVGNRERGVISEGPVGLPSWGRSRLFRYEIRCWRDGTIPDVLAAVDSPRRVSADDSKARRVLELVPLFPNATWGRDELRTGEMWNSNSLTAWLLALSGHDTGTLRPPAGGRAPGWSAGLIVAAREQARVIGGFVPQLQGVRYGGRGRAERPWHGLSFLKRHDIRATSRWAAPRWCSSLRGTERLRRFTLGACERITQGAARTASLLKPTSLTQHGSGLTSMR